MAQTRNDKNSADLEHASQPETAQEKLVEDINEQIVNERKSIISGSDATNANKDEDEALIEDAITNEDNPVKRQRYRRATDKWGAIVFDYLIITVFCLGSIFVYHTLYAAPKLDDVKSTFIPKIAVVSLDQNYRYVMSNGGTENDVARYNSNMVRMLNDRGFLVLDKSAILGEVNKDYKMGQIKDYSVLLEMYRPGTTVKN